MKQMTPLTVAQSGFSPRFNSHALLTLAQQTDSLDGQETHNSDRRSDFGTLSCGRGGKN